MRITIKSNFLKPFAILLNAAFIASSNPDGLIYILEWTLPDIQSFSYIGLGQEPFRTRNCSFQNCFITDNRSIFDKVSDFDVILFDVCGIDEGFEAPLNRSEDQEYVLFGIEPSTLFPISAEFNNFFNMTWTYKLTSDVIHPYLVVKNNRGKVIGPRVNMKWEFRIDDMAPTSNDIICKIRNKKIAAAWIASNCYANSSRDEFVEYLQMELSKYNLQVDIYGKCGSLYCSKDKKQGLNTNCSGKIESDYYFYLAFENSFAEDYVTEKLLHALNHFAVPVVYGGANYTRFMPEGIYLNANKLGVQRLAKEMNAIIRDPQRYFNFFKWHGYYSFHDSNKDKYHDAVCGFCALLNNRTRRNERTVYKYISKWWNGFNEESTNIQRTTHSSINILPMKKSSKVPSDNGFILKYDILSDI